MEIECVKTEDRLTRRGFTATEEIKSRLKKVRDQHEAVTRGRKTEVPGNLLPQSGDQYSGCICFGGSSDRSEHESHTQG